MAQRLIDADVLITAVIKKAIDDAFFGGNTDMHKLLISIVAHQPTIDAEPVRHGKWTRKHNYGSWECSECGCKVNRTNPLKGNIWNYYYCPNCGADMREES